ncbi:MAG: hypothetical protein GXX87_01425 [Euryarchaeota archaeon]|nr:hypothetical protein [Euryarchaeota archaeon]
MVTISVSCPIYPSEDPDKVRDAVLRIFPGMELEETDTRLSGSGSMENFSELIRKQKILDSTRSALFKGKHGAETRLRLNKQAAKVGKISFAEPRSVLGRIEVTVEGDDLETFIDTIAPATVDGKEVRP